MLKFRRDAGVVSLPFPSHDMFPIFLVLVHQPLYLICSQQAILAFTCSFCPGVGSSPPKSCVPMMVK